jgi:hypothetical protein
MSTMERDRSNAIRSSPIKASSISFARMRRDACWLFRPIRSFPGIAAPACDRCVSYFLDLVDYLTTEQRCDSIFVIAGHTDKDNYLAFMREFHSAVAKVAAGGERR